MTELLDKTKKYTGRSNLTIEDLLEKEGVYQFSKNKIFQDVYMKVGVINLTLDTTKTEYDKFLLLLKQYIDKFPQLINW